MLDHDLEPEDRSVRGSLVIGLSRADIDSLDVFEGNVGTFPELKICSPIMLLMIGIHQGEGSGPSSGSHRPTRGLRGPKPSSPSLHRGGEARPDTLHAGAPPVESFGDTTTCNRMRDVHLGVEPRGLDEGTLVVPRFRPT